MHSVDHFALRHVEGVNVANSEVMLHLLGWVNFHEFPLPGTPQTTTFKWMIREFQLAGGFNPFEKY